MSRPKKPDPEDEEPRDIVPRPAPYPLDEALEEAYAPAPGNFTLPGHTDDEEYQEDEDSTVTAASHQLRKASTFPTSVIEQAIALLEANGIPLTPELAKAKATGETGQTGNLLPGNLPPETAATAETAAMATGNAAWDHETPPGSQFVARARIDPDPDALTEELKKLRPWKAKYVLALMELGGHASLAATRCSVSVPSVEAAQATDPAFAAACAHAVRHTTDVLEAAVYRGATIGDLMPVYQGGLLVGYKRVRNTKDAELALKLRGKLREHSTQEVIVKGSVHVSQASDEEMIGIMERVKRELFDGRRGRPVIDIEAQNETIGDG